MTPRLYPRFGVLLVDDEASWLRSLTLTLRTRAGITHVTTCTDSRDVMGLLEEGDHRLVVLDLTMPHLSGEELLARVAEERPGTPVIVLSGVDDLATAVRCMRAGAFDYFVKTDEEERIVGGVLRAVRMIELEDTARELGAHVLSSDLQSPAAFAEIVTRDRAMLSVFSYLESVARSPHPLCIQGESGTGKELLVRAVHALEGGAGKLVPVNVAGLDDAVFADTLFGHVRGAFTGADAARRGMIEEAAGGTLFLDEIGDLSPASQVKLLRLLQEGEYLPLGADQPRRLAARVVVATHADLAQKVASGQFRRDLYFRLQTHRVTVPPLRSRPGDLPLLVEHFAAEAARTLGKPTPAIPRGLVPLLARYAFPGNVRELRAMVTDAVSVCQGRSLPVEPFVARVQAQATPERPGAEPEGPEAGNPFAGFGALPTFKQSARFLVEEAMARAGGNQTLAARLLGISQPALNKRLRRIREDDPL